MSRLNIGSVFTMTVNRVVAAILVIGAMVVPLEAAAQAMPKVHRIAFINIGPAAQNIANVAAFKAGLVDHGYVEGRNVVIDFRWGDQKVEQLPALVNELLALKPDVIVSTGGPLTVRAVRAATTTFPVVFITGDPVAEGIVQNLARPGGNFTGIAALGWTLDAKRLEILTQLVPRAKRIAVVWNPSQPYAETNFKEVEAAGKQLGLTLLVWKARDRGELEVVFSEIEKAKPEGLLILADPVLGYERSRLVEFANANRLPSIYFWREFAQIGGLASYGASLPEAYRSSAKYVDRILKGAKPGEMAIEQPTKFEFIVNRKTAKAMGLSIPQEILLRADEVVE